MVARSLRRAGFVFGVFSGTNNGSGFACQGIVTGPIFGHCMSWGGWNSAICSTAREKG